MSRRLRLLVAPAAAVIGLMAGGAVWWLFAPVAMHTTLIACGSSDPFCNYGAWVSATGEVVASVDRGQDPAPLRDGAVRRAVVRAALAAVVAGVVTVFVGRATAGA